MEMEDVAIRINEGLAKARERDGKFFPLKLQEAAYKGIK